MKQIILSDGLYQDINSLSNVVNEMIFEDSIYGKEVINFNYIPAMLDTFFTSVNGVENITFEIQPNTGTFRKPSDLIHFENFYQHSLWLVIVAFEDTVLRLHKHKDTGVKTFFDVTKNIETFAATNASAPQNWEVTAKINIEKNNFVFIRPWVWHSLEKDKLVQVFMLNQKLEEPKD